MAQTKTQTKKTISLGVRYLLARARSDGRLHCLLVELHRKGALGMEPRCQSIRKSIDDIAWSGHPPYTRDDVWEASSILATAEA